MKGFKERVVVRNYTFTGINIPTCGIPSGGWRSPLIGTAPSRTFRDMPTLNWKVKEKLAPYFLHTFFCEVSISGDVISLGTISFCTSEKHLLSPLICPAPKKPGATGVRRYSILPVYLPGQSLILEQHFAVPLQMSAANPAGSGPMPPLP